MTRKCCSTCPAELYEPVAVLGDRATKLGSAITKNGRCLQCVCLVAGVARAGNRAKAAARRPEQDHRSVNMIAPEKADVRELTAPETSEQ